MIKNSQELLDIINRRRPWNKKVIDNQLKEYFEIQDQRIKDMGLIITDHNQRLNGNDQSINDQLEVMRDVLQCIEKHDNLFCELRERNDDISSRLLRLEENTQNNNDRIDTINSRLLRLEENTQNNNDRIDTINSRLLRLEENIRNNNDRIEDLEKNGKNNNNRIENIEKNLRYDNDRVRNIEENTRNNNVSIEQLWKQSKVYDNITERVENISRYGIKLSGRIDLLEKKICNSGNVIFNENEIDRNNISQNYTNDINSENEYADIDYFDFENHFRGSREQTRETQKQYLDYYVNRKKVLDLGCGRGEFLELLKEYHIGAVGVDYYKEFVEYCKLRQLHVVEGDAIEFLRNVDYTDGIFAGQLVEHLEVHQIIELCNLAYQKLDSGAYFIVETPNPMSLAIYTHAFYIDPSHIKPVHPLTMQYFMEKAGFEDVRIVFTQNSKLPVVIPELKGSHEEEFEEFNKSMKIVEDTLFGSQDYAIIAKK